MKNEIIYLLLNEYADHEPVFLASCISNNSTSIKKNPKYINKIVAPTLKPVCSCCGFKTIPDYSFETMPKEYAALVLIGGYGWLKEDTKKVIPIIQNAIEKGIIIGAICNASSFMAKAGFLNNIRHTGNGLEQLKLWGGKNYTNEKNYVNEQAVSDGKIVTANGSAYLEFAKELLLLLDEDTPQNIEMWYTFFKEGLIKMMNFMKQQ